MFSKTLARYKYGAGSPRFQPHRRRRVVRQEPARRLDRLVPDAVHVRLLLALRALFFFAPFFLPPAITFARLFGLREGRPPRPRSRRRSRPIRTHPRSRSRRPSHPSLARVCSRAARGDINRQAPRVWARAARARAPRRVRYPRPRARVRRAFLGRGVRDRGLGLGLHLGLLLQSRLFATGGTFGDLPRRATEGQRLAQRRGGESRVGEGAGGDRQGLGASRNRRRRDQGEGSKRGLAPFFASSASRLTSADAFASPRLPRRRRRCLAAAAHPGCVGNKRDTRRARTREHHDDRAFCKCAHVGLCQDARGSHAKLVFNYCPYRRQV